MAPDLMIALDQERRFAWLVGHLESGQAAEGCSTPDIPDGMGELTRGWAKKRMRIVKAAIILKQKALFRARGRRRCRAHLAECRQ